MLRGRICLVWRCVSELTYLSPMGWPCIYSGCSTSWTVTKGPSHWMECFLFLSHIGFGTGFIKSDLFEIIFLSLLIMFDLIGWTAHDLGIMLFFVPVGIFP